MEMSHLTVLTGLPGCGKSTWLRTHGQTRDIVLCPDDFRLALTGHTYFAAAEDAVWSHVKIAARVLLKKGHDVVIDATGLTIGSRRQWIQLAQDVDVPVTSIYFEVPFEICMERNKNEDRMARGTAVPEEVIERMHETFEVPTLDEGFDSIEIIMADGNTKCIVR